MKFFFEKTVMDEIDIDLEELYQFTLELFNDSPYYTEDNWRLEEVFYENSGYIIANVTGNNYIEDDCFYEQVYNEFEDYVARRAKE